MQGRGKKEETDFQKDSYASRIERSLSKNNAVFLLAPDGFGKTFILKSLAQKRDRKTFYIDLKRIASSPENLAIDFISKICAAAPHKAADIESLRALKLKPRCAESIRLLDNELLKIKPDQRLIVKLALGFPELFAAENGQNIVVALDNFEELLALDNFSSIKNSAALLLETSKSFSHARFLLASSSVNLLKSLLKKESAEIIELSSFSESETRELFESVCGKVDPRISKEVFAATGGLPVAVMSVGKRFAALKNGSAEHDANLIRNILLAELSTAGSPLSTYCAKLFSDSLNRARGASLLKTVLQVMSGRGALRLTEISRLIYRSAPVTKSLLERLVEADLIVKRDALFDFSNPVLKQWCRLMFLDVEFDDFDDAVKGVGGLLR